MKITFEGEYIENIFQQMENMLATTSRQTSKSSGVIAAAAKPQSPGPEVKTPVEKSVDIFMGNPVDKPVAKRERTPKQLENDERLRVAAKAKVEAKRVAKARLQPIIPEMLTRPSPPLATAEGMDPAEVIRVRQKTIEDLQTAYANGHQQEVFELLSRFGNGAKSFRELPPEAFMPIRQAIDNGALT